MTICLLAQLNFTVGRIEENSQKILDCLNQAKKTKKADLVIFPELALSGYPPEDLLFRQDFLDSIQNALEAIIKKIPKDIMVIIGYPEQDHKKLYNSAAVILNNKIIANHRKQILPNYGVFDEKRYFEAGSDATVFEYQKIKFGLTICEDLWHKGPAEMAKKADAEILISINASPFHVNKYPRRIEKMRSRIAETQLPILYLNHCTGQDDLIFEGASFALNKESEVFAQGKFFEEDLLYIPLNNTKKIKPSIPSDLEQCYQALVLGTRDYVLKNNFKKVLLGFSGGIDSALTLAVAIDALGKENVLPVILPTRHTSQLSLDLAEQQLKKFGIKKFKTINIDNLYENYIKLLDLKNKNNLTTQNIQARIRGNILMALANQENLILLNTSNKSEVAAGYGTLYGDLCGGYAVLKDVWKTEVYKLAKYKNLHPEIIERLPTAELAPNQFDTDNLPPYEILDAILKYYIEQDLSAAEIIKLGFKKETVTHVIKLVKLNEYKRKQVALGPRVTRRAFTRERRYPITSG
ncbi:MAG TPA: NAD+ synthase [Gammaproteobacteria bacterium]|nr:NAD+ synthase [Gammaproteobacteria bacterium]